VQVYPRERFYKPGNWQVYRLTFLSKEAAVASAVSQFKQAANLKSAILHRNSGC
jgi:hypothetical protein